MSGIPFSSDTVKLSFSLRDIALRLVREGITTSSELLRVISEDD